AGLNSENPRVRRAALVALDQMDGSPLKPQTVAPYLTSAEPLMKDSATWIVSRHAEWGTDLSGFLRKRLALADLPIAERTELEAQLGRFSRGETIQQLLAERLQDGSAPSLERRSALRAMAQAGLKETPKPWLAGLAATLASGDLDLVR